MIKTIQNKIKLLETENSAIYFTCDNNSFGLTDYDEKRLLEIKAKIQVLNEVIILFGIQK